MLQAYVEAFQNADLNQLSKIFSEDIVFQDPSFGCIQGKENVLAAYAKMFKENRFSVKLFRQFQNGRCSTIEFSLTVTDSQRKAVIVEGVDFIEIVDNKITSIRAYLDTSEFIQQPLHSSCRIKDSQTIIKPWGKEVLIEKNAHYAFKEIWMKKGTRSSLQSHEKKRETIYLNSGQIELEIINSEGKSFFEIYRAGEAYSIAPRLKHRVKVLEDSSLFEVSTPQLDDIIRHEDDYNRG